MNRSTTERMPEFVRKPIWGLGPVGWVLVPVLIALAVCAAAGIDLRFQFFRAILATLGIQAVYSLVTSWLVIANFSMLEPTFGFLPLLTVLLACHFSPRRVAWWKYALLVAWAFASVNVNLYLDFSLRRVPWVGGMHLALAKCAVEILVTGGLLWLITLRLKIVAAAIAGAVFARLVHEVIGGFATAANWDTMKWALWSTVVLYHASLAAGLLWWGRISRAEQRSWAHACHGCGYDLGGLRPDTGGMVICPECALERAPDPAPTFAQA